MRTGKYAIAPKDGAHVLVKLCSNQKSPNLAAELQPTTRDRRAVEILEEIIHVYTARTAQRTRCLVDKCEMPGFPLQKLCAD